MSKLNKTKIDWCDFVWNPVWGCDNKCNYCYARKIARRFWKVIFEKEIKFLKEARTESIVFPHLKQKKLENPDRFAVSLKSYEAVVWLESNFHKKFPKKSSKIFVNSMSEIFYWPGEVMTVILNRIKKHPEHIFIFLTKFPSVYNKYDFPSNCWLGVSAEVSFTTRWWELAKIKINNIKFLSLEPLCYFRENEFLYHVSQPYPPDWIIIGFQTNPYRPARREYIEFLINYTRKEGIPLFIKDNVYRAYPDLPVLKEFPQK